MQPNPTDAAAEVTILRGKVAELERQLWQARHDYGQALQQNARHATTIAMMRKAQARTAEDERRDVLAFLRARNAISQGQQVDVSMIWNIERGDHVGAADRDGAAGR